MTFRDLARPAKMLGLRIVRQGEYVSHYHTERPHRTSGRRIIEPETPIPTDGEVLCRERLGGLLKTYCRQGA